MILSEGSYIKIEGKIYQVLKINSESDRLDDEEDIDEPLNEFQEILLHEKDSEVMGATHILKIDYNDNTKAILMEIINESDSEEGEEIFSSVNEKEFDVEDIEILY